MITIIVPGELRGKGRPRFARAGKGVRVYTDAATVDAEKFIRFYARAQHPCFVPFSDPLTLSLIIGVGIPASWSATKRLSAVQGGIFPAQKPDIDNAAKLVGDALNGIIWLDDKQIVTLYARKRYSLEPSTIIEVTPA